MNYLVFSDIHGSAYYTEQIEQVIKSRKFEKIILLGDVLYHGPRNPLPEGHDPMKVVSILNKYRDKIIAVRGNCDAEIDRELCQFSMEKDYVTMKLGDREVFITHGHIYNPEMHEPLGKGSLFIYGHVHLPIAREERGIYYLNPGSIALPKQENPNSYGILTEQGFTIYDFKKNVLNEIHFLD